MTDWADEIAEYFKLRWETTHGEEYSYHESYIFNGAEFATALRKAKADGMREAADIALREEVHCLEGAKAGDQYFSGSHGAAQSIKSDILAAADKIEKGET